MLWGAVWVLVFALLEWLAISFTSDGTHVVVLRPAAGILAGFCLLAGARRSVKFLIAAALGSAIARSLAFGFNPVFLPIGLVMAACSWSASWSAQRYFGPNITFGRWRETLGFIAISAAVSILGGFAFATLVLFSSEIDFLRNAFSWALSSALASSIFAPMIVICAYGGRRALGQRRKELLLSFLIMLAVLALTFSQPRVPFLFMIPIAVMIVAMIADMEGAALALAFTSVVALSATSAGYGPMALVANTRPGEILKVEEFLALITVFLLPVAAALSEREKLKKQMAAAMRESRRNAELLRQIIDAVDDHAIIMLDAEGRVATWNKGAEWIKGYSADEILGQRTDCFFPAEALAAKMPERLLQTAIENGHVHDEGWRLRKDGSRFWASLSIHVMRDVNGKLLGFSKVTRDLTARKAHEDALAAAKEDAQVAAQAKADFLANMSHEIRTPLTSVIGFSDLLWERDNLDEAAQGFVGRIRDGSRQLLALVNDILDYSKIESGQIDLRPSPGEPARLADEVVQLLALQAEAKGLELILDVQPGAGGHAVMMDAPRMRQVLVNYVGNAIKFTDQGRVTLILSLTQGSSSGRTRLRYEVRDTGPGIAPGQQDRLFRRFTQLDSSAGKRHAGTGLGLAICKGIALAMGGDVGVQSRPGEGASFWIDVPVTMAAEPEGPARRADEGVARVLVADDHDANLTLVKMALMGHAEVVCARDGQEALTAAADKVFDLILLDIRMPVMDGVEAMKAIRARLGAGCPPVIAFTADTDGVNLEALIGEGFDATMPKPLGVDALRRCVAERCDGARAEAEGRHVA